MHPFKPHSRRVKASLKKPGAFRGVGRPSRRAPGRAPQINPGTASLPEKAGAMVKLKRAYEEPGPGDGRRLLVDRLWPRGVKKTDAQLTAWLKDLAPSDELRRWFDHNPDRWEEFQQRYLKELAAPEKAGPIEDLLAQARQDTVTLVFAAKDRERNNAVVLKNLLETRLGAPAG